MNDKLFKVDTGVSTFKHECACGNTYLYNVADDEDRNIDTNIMCGGCAARNYIYR